MDIFKLLTRSTNLQKSSSSSKKTLIPHIPSAGASTHPLLFEKEDDATDSQQTDGETEGGKKGKKRRRDTDGEAGELGFSEELNFFGEASRPEKVLKKPSRDMAPPQAFGNGDTGKEKGEPTAVSAAKETLGEEDCRSILKLHKLKVTVIGEEQALPDKPKERRKDAQPKQITNFKQTHTPVVPQPLTSFNQLRSKYGLSKRLAENLKLQGYKVPTEVQLGSLPLLLGSDTDRGLLGEGRKEKKGKHHKSDLDLLTVAPTGSGKTLAFLIPVLYGLLKERHAEKKATPDPGDKSQGSREARAIIVAPTRELADQIVNEGRRLAMGIGLRISGMRKGMTLHADGHGNQEDRSDGSDHDGSEEDHEGEDVGIRCLVKADVLVSTPLMLLHAITAEETSKPKPLPSVRYLVLDEADVLLDPIFRDQTLGIWNACINHSLRVSLWSATIGSSIETLAHRTILARRKTLQLPSTGHYIIRLVVGLKDSAIPIISHRLVYAATEQGKLLAIRQLLHPTASVADQHDAPSLRPPFLVFTQTIPRATALHSELMYDIPPAAGGSSRIAVLHSSLSLNARSAIMARFRAGEIWVLITTDLLSRGVDFKGMNGVVNYDIPTSGASYVHRVGRTGRAGREGGVAVTLYTKEDVPYVKGIANVIAASEKAHGGKAKDVETLGVQKWLLNALPTPSKKMKKELKKKGVEARRSDNGGNGVGRKARISTKSGFERRLENNRKGAVLGSRRRVAEEEILAGEGANESEGEWGGIKD
ncbi:MAG: hypothetical protein FRX48_01537 [Lasallia pustulata]|uniref:ATP-dependent RNA helicase n=1 Tax=Lasallia pustulata TaxID=136370 RepID=A0A5M8PZ96_9LECA|nr:MAG: hypothetical protein FRX48_01537 [Lasallia pustulata]